MKKRFVLLVPLILISDQLSKWWASNILQAEPNGYLQAASGFWGWQYAENTGAAFSIMQNNPWFLLVGPVILIVAVLVMLFRLKGMPNTAQIGLWMVVGGGVGNLIDRMRLGYVVDFIKLEFINFAIFNLADSFLCVGVGLAAVAILLHKDEKKERRNEKLDG